MRAAGCLRAARRFGKPASDAGASLARAGHAVRSCSAPVRAAQRSCVVARRQQAHPRSVAGAALTRATRRAAGDCALRASCARAALRSRPPAEASATTSRRCAVRALPAAPAAPRRCRHKHALTRAPPRSSPDTGIAMEKDMRIQLRDDAANGVNEDGSTWCVARCGARSAAKPRSTAPRRVARPAASRTRCDRACSRLPLAQGAARLPRFSDARAGGALGGARAAKTAGWAATAAAGL